MQASPPRRLDRRLFLPERPGEPAARGLDPEPDLHVVSHGYFDAMGIRILRGTGFGAQHDRGSDPVTVISQRLADILWPGAQDVPSRWCAPRRAR